MEVTLQCGKNVLHCFMYRYALFGVPEWQRMHRGHEDDWSAKGCESSNYAEDTENGQKLLPAKINTG